MIECPADITAELKVRILRLALERTQVVGECIEWIGVRCDGYGTLGIDYKTYKAHRLMALIFVEGWFEGAIVRHLCNNRACVNDKHLAWGTRQENALDVRAAGGNCGSRNKGYSNGMAKLLQTEVQEIKDLCAQGVNQYKIAEKFGVAQSLISRIKNGTRRSNVP